MSLEFPSSQPIETNTTETIEKSAETLSPDEEVVVQKGIAMHQAMKEYDQAFTPMIARRQEGQLSDIYGEKWKGLSEEYNTAYDALSDESKKKVWEGLNKKLGEMGLLPESKL